ncbi:MAG TPA: hypothetical protein VHH36_03360 [Candidatus Thermoplasmatota archaeon]|nr:hypothetical protein [Candidatus Thermoplasmatota archaeon]
MRALALVAAACLLAGCGDPAPEGEVPEATPTGRLGRETPAAEPAPDPPTDAADAPPAPIELRVALEAPAVVVAGEPFLVVVRIEASANASSDHVGLHHASNASLPGSDAPACDHLPGAVPGNFTLSCVIQGPGQHGLRADARVDDAGGPRLFWSETVPLTVRPPVPRYEVEILETPTQPLAPGASFALRLRVAGNATETVGVGARLGNATTDVPSDEAYPWACAMRQAQAPGDFDVRCDVPADAPPGPLYVRGLARVFVGDDARDAWSEEAAIVVQ